MERLGAFCAFLVVSVVLTACGTTEKRYLESQESLGGATTQTVRQLRRLVLLPPLYAVEANPGEPWDSSVQSAIIMEKTTAYMAQWRGYQVVPAKPLERSSGKSLDELRNGLLAYQAEVPRQGPIPEELAGQVRDIAKYHDADGVLVYGLLWKGMTARSWATTYALALFTFTIGMYPYVFSHGTYGSAAIYEGQSGRLVWGAHSFGGGIDKPGSVDEMLEPSFSSLPNVLPVTRRSDQAQ